jgi:hypothetical protein
MKFEQRTTPGRGSFIEVSRRNIRLGCIRQRPDTGAYCYFRGMNNLANVSFERDDIESLKELIAKNP